MLQMQGRNYQQQRFFARPVKMPHLSLLFRQQPREKISRSLRKAVLGKNGCKCYCCNLGEGEKGRRLEMHHIVPVNFKGKTEEGNLLPLCFNCHKSVHKLIAAMHISPVKFKRSALEGVVLKIAEMRKQEKINRFWSMPLKTEGPMNAQPEVPSQEEAGRFGLMLFVLSLALSKRQFRRLKKEIKRQAWKDSLKNAA